MDWKCWNDVIELTANVVVIIGAIIALFEWGRFLCRKKQKRTRLEEYLKDQKREDSKIKKKGQRSLTHLVAKLGISEAEILDLAFGNRKVELKVKEDEQGYADKTLFVYKE